MLQPEKEHLHPLHLVQSFSTLLSPEELLKISMYSIHPEKSSHDLWGWDQVSGFLKISPSPIHSKLRSTVDYTALSGLTKENMDYELSISTK